MFLADNSIKKFLIFSFLFKPFVYSLRFKNVPIEIRTEIIKPFLDLNAKIKLYLAVPIKENLVFKNSKEFVNYLITSPPDPNKTKNIIKYAKKTEIIKQLSHYYKLKILKISTKELNYELFLFLTDYFEFYDHELNNILRRLILKKDLLNEQEETAQLNIIKLLLTKNHEFTKYYLNDVFLS